jgi:predicted permease
VPPALGRLFSAEDDAPKTPETVVLTHGYWQSRFGGDPAAVGQNLVVDARPRQIIGVTAREFRVLGERAQVILPFRFNRADVRLGNFNYPGLGRLKPGVSVAQANADLTRLVPTFVQAWPLPPGISRQMAESARITPELRPLKARVVGNIGDVLWVLTATIGIVLVIACANVANLLLVRTEGRQQELAVRSALGAGKWRVMRALLVESVMLSLLGGTLGLVLAFFGLKLLVAAGPSSLPRLEEIAIDPVVLGFTLAVSVASGLAFGLVAVLRRTNHHIAQDLRGGGRTASSSRERHRTRNVLVVAQIGLATVLVIAAGLMVRSFVAMRQVHPGFSDATQLQLVTLPIPSGVVRGDVDVFRVQKDVRDRIAALHGVTSASFVSTVPMDGPGSGDPLLPEHKSYPEGQIPPIRWYWFVSPGHFQTLRTPMVAGRDFTWTDIESRRPVVIVSENLAREVWADPAAAVGKRVRENPEAPWREVVGVVANVHAAGVDIPPPAIVYWPALMENFWGNKVRVSRTMTFVVRSDRAGTEGLVTEIRQAVSAVNSSLPLTRIRTLSEVYVRSMARTSFALVMLAIAGAMALFLSVIGIYGVLSYTVVERTREIGIRVALGAEGGLLRRMFVRNGLVLAAVGVVVGLGGALGLSRLITSLLFGVESMDPATYITASLVLVAAAALASYIPARRATRVSPVTALRAEA